MQNGLRSGRRRSQIMLIIGMCLISDDLPTQGIRSMGGTVSNASQHALYRRTGLTAGSTAARACSV
jgi:hypothetical protein